MFRSHTCGELRISDVNKQVTLAGWVQRSRKMGGMTFIDLRDRYGITQLVFNEEVDAALCENANRLGREFVIQITGTVNERFSKNANIPTGDIEIIVSELNVLNAALTPPFTIEDNTATSSLKTNSGDTVIGRGWSIMNVHTSHFAAALHPTCQRYLLIDIGDTKFSAGV